MISHVFLLVLFVANPAFSKAQQDPNRGAILKLEGKVVNAESQQPLEVKTTITYETLPHGSDVGITNINPSATYEFYLRKNNSYKVQAKAKGYLAMSRILEPANFTKDDAILNFELKPVKVGDILKYDKLQFEQGKANITTEASYDLEDLVATLNMNPGMEIRIEGHTDISGNPKLNMELSEQRVEEVKYFIIDRGISKNRIETEAFGETRPLVTSGTLEDRSVNRRVEIRIMAI